MKICPGKKSVLSFAVATLAGIQVMAQQPANGNLTAYHSAIIKATFRKIHNEHYSPRPIDDSLSARVWSQFILLTDPNHHVYLKEDIDQLAAYKNSVDDDLNNNRTTYFDAAYSIYSKRVKEAEAICMELLAKPFDFSVKETFTQPGKDTPAPATAAARKEAWRKLLKFQTLQHYTALEKKADAKSTVNPALEAQAREIVRNYYAGVFHRASLPNDTEEKFSLFLAVATGEIDPHTAYTGPQDHSFNDMITKKYCGIGIELGQQDASFFVKRIMPGGTAYRSGQVKENDRLLSIGDETGKMQQVSGWDATQVTAMIRGEKGTAVTMYLQQPGEEPRKVSVDREELLDTENKAKGALIEKNGKNYGYIYLPMFYIGQQPNGAAMDVYNEMIKFRDKDLAGMVIDLRGNGGGSLDEVVRLAGCFTPQGPVTMLRSRDNVNGYTSVVFPSRYDGPLTVLVDESSASASEIFAAAMQDRGRALIVGASSTYGKGTAQATVMLGKMGDSARGIPDTSYGSIRLTQNKFYRITGAATQLRGVIPDIILQDKMRPESMREKDFTSSLAYDTIAPLPFEKMTFPFNYKTVVADANARIKANQALAAAATDTKKMQERSKEPIPLNLVDFRKSNAATKQLETALKQSLELPATAQLHLTKVENPGTIPADKALQLRDQEWMDKLGKDVYLGETISILEDMNSHKQ